MKIRIRKTTVILAVLIGLPLLSSCSLIGEAISITSNRMREVPESHSVSGQGFEFRAPDSGLYPIKDYPQKGAVTFREVHPTFLTNTYFAIPFSHPSVNNLEQALYLWNHAPTLKGNSRTAIEKRRTTYRGRPAIDFLVQLPASAKSGNLVRQLLVQRENDYLILACGLQYFLRDPQQDLKRQKKILADDFKTMKSSVSITAP